MSDIVIPSSEADRKKIRDVVIEINGAMTRIASEKDFIKEAIERLTEEVEISKKVVSKMAKVYYKQNLSEVLGEAEDLESIYTIVMQENSRSENDESDSDDE